VKAGKLGKAPLLPLLLKMMIPPMLGMATMSLYNIIDCIYIGQISKEALTALSLAFPLQMLIISTAVGTGAGATSLISRLLGRGRKKKAVNTAEHVLLLALVYGLTAGVTGFLGAEELYSLFTDNALLIKTGSPYIRIIMAGSTAMFIPMLGSSILRGEGNTFLPMIIITTGALLNIILDPFFIYGLAFFPAMGVKGAAVATVIARSVSGIVVLLLLFKGRNELKLTFSLFRFSPGIIIALYKVALPAMLMQLIYPVLLMGINKILVAYGMAAVAAFGIFFRLQSFAFMPVFGLGQAIMPICGFNYGHGNKKRTLKSIQYGLTIGSLITLLAFIFFQFSAPLLVKMFNSDKAVLQTGITALRSLSYAFIFSGFIIITIVILQAFGRGLSSLIITLLRSIIFVFPLAYWLGRSYGLDMLWFAYPIAEVSTLTVCIIWLYLLLKKIRLAAW
ncbi:MAG TPA: MATE family efflux transporter, partial [Spirochaetota bacterium]|nr:MATE family efflux transporter [Spirochaetota bacterium]